MDKKEKLKWILNTCKKNKITGYQIGKETVLSSYAVSKILDGTTKNPNQATIDIIENYLSKKLMLPNPANIQIQEDKVVNKICDSIKPILDNISNKLDFIINNQR